jgi:Tfp pilus assembly protein PilX
MKNNRGVILLMTLLILSSILVVTLGASDIVMAGIKMNRQTGYSSIAFFASEAGLEKALWEARKNNNAVSWPATSLTNGSAYNVIYSNIGGNIIFQSIGSFNGVKRSTEGSY